MEQLPLVFDQYSVEPDMQECFTPAFNFTRIESAGGRLAFTTGKIYWLPDNPKALIDQGWVIRVSEIASYGKYGLAGFLIKLVDGKELRFSNVGGKMREGIEAAIEAHKGDVVAEAAPAAPAAPAAEAAPEVAPAAPVADASPAADATDAADASNNKVMAILAYLGILVLVPLLAAKDSKFARFHSNQGLILLIISVVIFFVGRIPGLATLAWILNTCVFILAIIGIVNAAKGRFKELPLIGKFRIIQ